MQRVTNCILIHDNQALLLQKPSKNWWVAPGGKMESEESIKESVIREYREETGLSILDPEIVSVSTIVVQDNGKMISEWMMFTFKATTYEGDRFDQSPEGNLEWKTLDEIMKLPMAEGDKFIFQHVIDGKPKTLYGTFYYTKEWKLTSYRID